MTMSSYQRRRDIRPSDEDGFWVEETEKLPCVSLNELIEWAEDHGFATDSGELLISDPRLYWWRHETSYETKKRLGALEASQARQEAWERDALVRLLAKYGLPEEES